MSDSVSFQSADQVTIVADYYPKQSARGAVLLLHMMPADRKSWQEFAQRLNQEGFTALAIDLRGHGESTLCGKERLDFKNFDDVAHQRSIRDVEAGVQFLEKEGFSKKQIFICGASIGANLAFWYQVDHPEIKKTVLLSPGFNYRGIDIEKFPGHLREDQEVFYIASQEDRLSAETCRKLSEDTKSSKLKIYQSAGHGTEILETVKDSIELVIDWLK